MTSPLGSVVGITALAYLGLLFAIALYADRQAQRGRSLLDNSYVHALSLGVYATSWTYYGSVGRAAQTGVEFMPIYLGPTLVSIVWWIVARKMLRISKRNGITSIADFIAWRYGKSGSLAALITVVATIGITPYIALQLKAVSGSVAIMTSASGEIPAWTAVSPGIASDTALHVSLVLAVFSIFFGTRQLDSNERHEGLVAALALESLIKLVAFVAVGAFVTWGMYDGFADIFSRAAVYPQLVSIMTMNTSGGRYEVWFALLVVSMLAFLCLPRQFQMSIVENVNEEHVRKATWLFPLYMLVINVFVLPIAFGGILHFGTAGVDPDTFVLTLPLRERQTGLALLVFVGGLSACTGMAIVETIALSIMISNDLVMPVLLRWRALGLQTRHDVSLLVIWVRRAAILLIMMLGYAYCRAAAATSALSAIGLMSFTAVAQFAPALLIGLYWTHGTVKGALAAISAGFGVWVYTMLLPSFADSGWLSANFIAHGPFGLDLLRPRALFGIENVDSTAHAVAWSLAVNVVCYVGVSLLTRGSSRERAHALLFVDADRIGHRDATLWRGSASAEDLYRIARRYVGAARADEAFARHARRCGTSLAAGGQVVDAEFLQFVERLLASAIGSASAQVMVASVVRSEPLREEEVFSLLDETSELINYNRRLEEKSQELEAAGRELAAANERLRSIDRQKDDFLSTVTHELRTPLASIQALSEILLLGPEIAPAQRARFMRSILKESQRLTRLINQVLDVARIKSGRIVWHVADVDLADVIDDALEAVDPLFVERGIVVARHGPDRATPVRADRDRMLQVLINLLSNAVKFSASTGPRIDVTLSESAACVTIEIADNGRGIRPEDRELVFDRFAQLADPEDGKPDGNGLGLSISRHIVEHFGGRLWVGESVGPGARLLFTVPRPA